MHENSSDFRTIFFYTLLTSTLVFSTTVTAEPRISSTMASEGEAVIYFSPEQAQAILGDHLVPEGVQRNESVIYISHRQAQGVLGDGESNLMTLDAINSMPATAAGHSNQKSQIRQENVTYINAEHAESVLGSN